MVTVALLPVIKCAPCRARRHGPACDRTRGIGPCHCLACWSVRDGEAALMAYRQATDPKTLRSALGALLAYRHQVRHRQAAIAQAGPLPAFPCACGRTLPDGTPCLVVDASPYGRTRRYARPGCRTYAYHRRQALAARTEAYSGPPAPPVPLRWPDRASFDAYWQAVVDTPSNQDVDPP